MSDLEQQLMHRMVRSAEEAFDSMASTYASTTTHSGPPITAEKVLATIKFMETVLGRGLPSWQREVFHGLSFPKPSSLFGVDIHASPYAVTRVQRRTHRWRRNQSEAYHRRINKKWLKRFGRIERPAIFKLGNGTITAHPSIVDRLRKEFGSDSRSV